MATFGYVRWCQDDTGEIKQTPMAGQEPWFDADMVERHEDWRQTSLELALVLIPDLERAIERARQRNRCVEVRVWDGDEATHV